MWVLLAASLALAGGASAGAETRPIQHGSSQGVRLSVYGPSTAVFDLSRATRHVRHLLSSGINPGWLKARLIKGHWHYSETSGQ